MLNKVATLGSSTQIPHGSLTSNKNTDKIKMPFFRKSRSASKSRQNVWSSAIWNNSNDNNSSNSNTYSRNNSLEPIELSWEQVVSNDGFVKHFLKVFCEKVRKGDHFKTVRIIGSTTAGSCIRELVETYYSKHGTYNDYYLCEIIGRIEPISSSMTSSTPVWSFTEQKVRRIDVNENLISLLQNTSPGYGLCRRLELRPVEINNMPTPVLTNENKSVNCSQVSLRESVTASRATLNSSRSCTPVNGITLFKDSRRGHFFRGIQIPQGPHLLLLRGNQPNHDSLLHDLTKLILDNTMQSYMSIGYGKHADIRLYPIPSERNSYEGEGMIAKVVGYNVVLKASPVTSKRGLVFLEPYDQNNDDINNKKNNENSSGNKTPNGLRSIPDSIEIYINNDLIKPSYANTFTRHQLRPGDLIFFGSQKRGYIYLFKDPRCTPDHKLELPFTSNRNLRSNYKTDKNVKNSKSDNNHTSISTSTTTTDEEDNDEITQRSTTGQQRTNSSATITLEEMKQDIKPIPTLSELEWIIEPLLIQLTLTETTFTSSTTSLTSSLTSQKLVSLDTLCTWEVTKNTILEPWRSACLLSLLIRATGLIKLRSNTSTVTTTSNNSSKNENSPLKTLRNNSMEDLLKQITSILSNYQKRAELTESNRPVFQFWLSLFFYDLAIYLTSGWLTHDIKSPSIIVDGKDIISSSSAMATPDLEHRHQDISRSELSLNHLFGELQAPEEVAEIDELRKLSYTLADQIIDKLVKTTCRAVLPYISSLYQCSPNNSPTRSQCDEMQFTSLTEWNSSRSELSRWLNQIVLCFDVAFYPSGSPSSAQNDTENLSINSTSLHSTASNKSPNGISNDEMHSQQYNYSHHHHQYLQHQQNQQTTHSRHTQKKSETSDLSMSGDSDVDNELLMGSKPLQLKKQSVADDEVFLSDHSRQNTLQSTENSSHYPIYSTMNHLEAIFWRQLLASISYEILNTILFTGTIKVDWETGMQLLNGVNWLENWLRSHKLDKHRRPLNMLMQVANLLATPRQKLFKMTWNDMRETYPSIPPALLRFLLEEYEEGYGVQNTNNWSIDEKDAAVVDEDPTDLIEIALKGWKSKERLRPAKPHHHQLPLYRPMDPYGLCTQTAMKSCINQLDGKLASNQSPCIHFRWHELMRQFPPPRVIPQIHGNRNSSINRSAIRHKLTVTNRRRLPIRTNNGRTSASPSISNQSPLPENKEFSPLPSKTQTSQFGSSMNTTNQTSRFPDGMKPRPSNGEPVWRGNHISEMSSDQVSGLDGNQQGFYCLKGLAASIGGIDLIGNANTDVDFPPFEQKYSNPRQMGSKPNNYPQESVYHSQLLNRKVISPHWSSQMLDTNRTETPVSHWYFDPRLQASNGLSQSVGDFNNGSRLPSNFPSMNRLQVDQLNEAANDWKQYRMSLLGQGLDKIRTSRSGSRSVTPGLIPNRNVSSSMSNLPTNCVPNPFKVPDVTIHEATDNSSEIVSDLDRGRDTDSDALSSVNLLDMNPERGLSDVLSRSGLGNSVSNVTLHKEPKSGFGLVLVDGERTSLDQPGVFVKSVAPNSVAEMNGTFRLGDRILAINGRDLTCMTYKDALALLRQCVNQTTFTVLRCNLPDPEALLKRKDI